MNFNGQCVRYCWLHVVVRLRFLIVWAGVDVKLLVRRHDGFIAEGHGLAFVRALVGPVAKALRFEELTGSAWKLVTFFSCPFL